MSHVWDAQLPTSQTIRVAAAGGHNSALCAHRVGAPAQAAPVRLCGSVGINALIETGTGQFCKCWAIKKATFYCPERPRHKAAFHWGSIWKWLRGNRGGLTVSGLAQPAGQIPSLFTQAGRAGSRPAVDWGSGSMPLLWLSCCVSRGGMKTALKTDECVTGRATVLEEAGFKSTGLWLLFGSGPNFTHTAIKLPKHAWCV